MKKHISKLLVCCLALGAILIPTASAAEGIYEDFTYVDFFFTGNTYLTISLYSNSSLSLFVIGIFYVLEILRNGIGFFPYEFTVLNIILFYFNFFFLRMWIILETATSSSISIPTCQYSLLFYSIILALSIILGLKWTKKFDFQLKNIFTTSY